MKTTYTAMTNLEFNPPMSFLMIGEKIEGQEEPCFTIYSVDDATPERRDYIVDAYSAFVEDCVER